MCAFILFPSAEGDQRRPACQGNSKLDQRPGATSNTVRGRRIGTIHATIAHMHCAALDFLSRSAALVDRFAKRRLWHRRKIHAVPEFDFALPRSPAVLSSTPQPE